MPTRSDVRQPQPPGLDFVRDVWSRRKWVALIVFAAVVAAAASVAASLPDLYRATATVLVETQQVSEDFIRTSVSAELDTRIQTIREDVMSRGRLGDLITRLDLYPELRAKGVSFDDIIDRMRRDIDFELSTLAPSGGRIPTIAFAIKYSGRNPQTVAQVANLLASLFIVENSKIREGQAATTAEFLKTQLDDVKKQLDEQERRTTQFNLSHIGELPEQVSAILASLERLNTQLRLNGENQVRTMDRRERFERQLNELPAAPAQAANDPARGAGSEEVVKLRQQLELLRRKYTDQYPEVIRVRGDLADLERQLAERKGTTGTAGATASAAAGPAPLDPRTRTQQAIADADAELRVLKNEEASLRQAVSSYEQRVENVPRRQEELETLSRDTASTKERYQTMLKKYEEAQLASSLEQGRKVEQFRVLDAAVPPHDPAAPGRGRLFVLGVCLALALSIGTIMAIEKVDTTFHSIDDLRAAISVPALFNIPRIVTTADVRRRRRRGVLTAVSVALGLALVISGSRYLARDNDRLVQLTAGARG